jgi:hypothetical protein
MVSISDIVVSLRNEGLNVSEHNSGCVINIFPNIIPPIELRMVPNSNSRKIEGLLNLEGSTPPYMFFMWDENLDNPMIIQLILNHIENIMLRYEPTLVIGENIEYQWRIGDQPWQTSRANVACDRDSGQAIPNPPNMTLISFERKFIGVFRCVSSGKIVHYRLKPVLPTDENIVIGREHRCTNIWKWIEWNDL